MTWKRQHILPSYFIVRCLLCGAETRFTIDELSEDGEGPLLDSPLLCSGCGNDMDARLERDLRRIADAAVSIRYFLPTGVLALQPKREKSWSVEVVVEATPPTPMPGP